jgi:hypothetical protein
MGMLHRGGPQTGLVEADLAALVRNNLPGEQTGEDLEGVLQPVEALRRRREVDAQLSMLGVEPGGTDGQLQATVRGVVHRHGLGGQDRRVSIGHARDQQAQANTTGHTGQGGQGGHPFEAIARSVAVHGHEVIEAPGSVEVEVLNEPGPAHDLVEIHPLLGDVDAEPHGPDHIVAPASGFWRRHRR